MTPNSCVSHLVPPRGVARHQGVKIALELNAEGPRLRFIIKPYQMLFLRSEPRATCP